MSQQQRSNLSSDLQNHNAQDLDINLEDSFLDEREEEPQDSHNRRVTHRERNVTGGCQNRDHEGVAAIVDAILERHCTTMRRSFEEKLSRVDKRLESQEALLDKLDDHIRSNENVLNAMALKASFKGKEKKGSVMRPQIQVQVDLVSSYLTQDIKLRTGCHIICKVITAHMKQSRHSFDSATDVLEVLLFAPDSSSRSRMRRTGPGQVFKRNSI